MAKIDEYLNENGEVVLPAPKFHRDQRVLVIRNGVIEIREIQEIIYKLDYTYPVFYKVSCVEGYVAERELFGTPQEFSEAILSTFSIDVMGKLHGDWSKRHWGM